MKSSKSESWEKFWGKKGNYLSEQQRRENNNVVGVCAVCYEVWPVGFRTISHLPFAISNWPLVIPQTT